MDRRKFIQSTLSGTAAAAITPSVMALPAKTNANRAPGKLLSAYYFRAHMYTLVPHQVREDLQWMADHGTDAVCVGILEQDLFAAVENVEIISNEAGKLGMKMFIIPSRWAGLVAGAPKCPSLFAVHNPHTWLIKEDGKPSFSKVSGVNCSIFYPEVADFFKNTIDEAVKLWNVHGIIWDEPKIYGKIDKSEAAIKKLGENAPVEKYNQAFTDFWSDINTHIKQNYSDVSTHYFLYAHKGDDIVNNAATIKNLDYYGCDGRPWGDDDDGVNESQRPKGYQKTLIGSGERFIPAAQKHGKKSLFLVENHNMLDKDVALMDKRFPEVLQKNVDHLIYYYYPRNLQNPEINMKVVAKHIKNFK
jgi:hypothetical protein